MLPVQIIRPALLLPDILPLDTRPPYTHQQIAKFPALDSHSLSNSTVILTLSEHSESKGKNLPPKRVIRGDPSSVLLRPELIVEEPPQDDILPLPPAWLINAMKAKSPAPPSSLGLGAMIFINSGPSNEFQNIRRAMPRPTPPKGIQIDQLTGESSSVTLKTIKLVLNMLQNSASRRAPRIAWFDYKGVLKNMETGELRHDVLGMLFAFKQRGSRIGLFTKDMTEDIIPFMEKHPVIKLLLSKHNGSYMIRDGAYMKKFAKELAAKTQKELEEVLSGLKFVGPDEILIDDCLNEELFDSVLSALRACSNGMDEVLNLRKNILMIFPERGSNGLRDEEKEKLKEILDNLPPFTNA